MKKTTSKACNLEGVSIPDDCDKIILQQNNSKIIIHNECNKNDGSRNSLLLKKMKEFFDKKENWEIIAPVLQQRNKISLRLLDWLVTNYSKKKNVMIEVVRNGTLDNVNMFLDYKAHLKAYSKKSFDPFCRRERMLVEFAADPEGRKYITTVAQLTFFRWCIQLGVLKYCEEHHAEIEADMVSNLRVHVDSSRRRQISESATSSLTRHNISRVLSIN